MPVARTARREAGGCGQRLLRTQVCLSSVTVLYEQTQLLRTAVRDQIMVERNPWLPAQVGH